MERNRANVVGVVKPPRQQGKWRGNQTLLADKEDFPTIVLLSVDCPSHNTDIRGKQKGKPSFLAMKRAPPGSNGIRLEDLPVLPNYLL